MSSRRQRSITLGGRYRQVSLYYNCCWPGLSINQGISRHGIRFYQRQSFQRWIIACSAQTNDGTSPVGLLEPTSVKFESNHKCFLSEKCTWIWRLQKCFHLNSTWVGIWIRICPRAASIMEEIGDSVHYPRGVFVTNHDIPILLTLNDRAITLFSFMQWNVNMTCVGYIVDNYRMKSDYYIQTPFYWGNLIYIYLQNKAATDLYTYVYIYIYILAE